MMSARRPRGITACLLTTALLAGCGSGGNPNAKLREARPSAALYTRTAAAAIAGRLLAGLPVPAHTDRLARLPVSAVRRLGAPRRAELSAKTIDRPAYWISTAAPLKILHLLAANGPAAKLEYSGYGGVRGRTEEWSERLGAPTASPLAGPREINISIVHAGAGRYAVRIDALVAWHRRRPTSSLVPSRARWLEVRVVQQAFHPLPGEPARARQTHEITVTSLQAVQAIARAVNELPLAEPSGTTPSCPAMSLANTVLAPKVILLFRSTASSAGNLARVVTDSGYVCSRAGEATAKITVSRGPGLLLTDHLNGVTLARGTSLTDRIEVLLDHRLHLPSSG